MKKKSIFGVVLALITFTSIQTSCTQTKKQQETVNTVPRYSLFKTDKPNVLPDGSIPPLELVRYWVNVPEYIEKDSLELLQNYFINKGKSDFKGVEKIVVFVFVEGMNPNSNPYATLFYRIDDEKRDITINGPSSKLEFLKEKLAGYEILGCWIYSRTEDLIICKKSNKLFGVIVDKKKKEVGDFDRMKTKQFKGDTAYYFADEGFNDYSIIKSDGLYTYFSPDYSEPSIMSNDPEWDKINNNN